MTLFFLLLRDSSSFLHPRVPGCAVPGEHPHLPRARRPSSIGDRSSNSTTRPRRPSAANRPPLWGLRDSGPYLHDGRAKTLDEAVMWHGGQGAESARQFQALTRVERLQVQAFQQTLVAPASAGSPEVSLAVKEDGRAVQQGLQRPRDEAVSRQPTCRL